MENEILDNIKNYAIGLFQSKYGYCGIAESDKNAVINTDDGKGNNIIIKIEIKED